jgi:midasin
LLNFHPNGPLSFITGALSPISIDTLRLEQLLLAYYRILQANRELPRTLLWTLAPLSNLIHTPHLSNGVLLLGIRCYSLQSGMGEEERCSLEREILGEPCGIDCNLNYGQNVDGSEKEVDGWLLPVLEMRRVQQERELIVSEQLDFYSREDGNDTFLMETTDLRLAPIFLSTALADSFSQSIGRQCARRFAPSLLPRPPF